jgi:RNA polymerase sigma factor (sigma-70 family)
MENQPSTHGSDSPSELSVLATEMLWALSQEGDDRATGKFFLRVEGRLRTAIRNHPSLPHIPSMCTEEDVLQDLWTRLFAHGSLDRFRDRGPGSLRGYLYVSLDHTIMDLCRFGNADKRGGNIPHQSVEGDVSESGGIPLPAAEGPGPATIAQWNDWESRCLGFLDGQKRTVWQLRFVEDLGYAAIAEYLGKTESAVRAFYHRAIEKLHRAGVLEFE